MSYLPRKLNVLVVDDEAFARQRIVDLLGNLDQPFAIAEAGDGETAVHRIEAGGIDLVFLDIQLPELTGVEVVQAVGYAQMPLTVFVTAYDTHAIEAFEANAVDYLLKPVSEDRFRMTMKRVESRLSASDQPAWRQALEGVSATAQPGQRWDRLVVKVGAVTRFVRATDIDLIESAGVYVTLHMSGQEILYRAPLHLMEQRLDPDRFVRVHRQAIVNIESVVQLEPISHGDFEMTLKNGARTKVSRSFRGRLEARLGQPL